MLSAHQSLALAIALLVVPGATSAPNASLLRKCRGTVQEAPVVFVDGRNFTESALQDLAPDNINSIQVACLNPLDSTLVAPGSTTPGLTGIILWTKLGPSSQLEPALSAVVKAQQAYFARTGAYARDRASLRLPALPEEVKVSLEVTSNGWSASAWLDRRFTPRCRVSDGNVAVPEVKSKEVIDCSDT